MPILTPEERLGQILAGRYRLEALLSTGGMGILFRACDTACGVDVAVKMLKPTHAIEPERVARFAREMRIARQIAHPYVARTLDAFDEHGVACLVLELLEGRTLAQELTQRGVLPVEETLAIVLPVVRALEAAHGLGIVHRDVKPSNVFLCRDATGRVTPKLIDFGIAKDQGGGFDTETGVLIGTPGYMAPEQLQYGECSTFTDIWGVGAVLHRCLTGHPPHGRSDAAVLLQKVVCKAVPPLAVPGVSRRLCATIDRALARDPHRRYPSMQALGRALAPHASAHDGSMPDAEHTTEAEPLAAQHPYLEAPSERRRMRPPVFALAAAFVICVFAAAAPHGATPHRHEPIASAAPARAAALRATERAPDRTVVAPQATAQPAHPTELVPEPAATAVNAARSNASKPRKRARTGAMPPPSAAPRRAAPPDTGSIEREPATGLPVATEW